MNRIKNALINNDLNYIEQDIWYYIPLNNNIPNSGWKIHISVMVSNYMSILELVIPILKKNNISFKIVKNYNELRKINSSRELTPNANKFITIYPKNHLESKETIITLFKLLKEFKSPKILSDFQCAYGSPVHYRYGAYKKNVCYNKQENRIMYMVETDDKVFVEDVRNNFPTMPKGVKNLFTQNEIEYYFGKDDNNFNVDSFKYKFNSILKKSNRGNVYKASDEDGNMYIIKQARPYIVIDRDQNLFAEDELKEEKKILIEFKNFNFTSNYVDDFYVNEDYFLVQKFIKGESLFAFIEKNKANNEINSVILDQLIHIFNIFHEKKLVLVDINPSNIIINENHEIFIIDLEQVTYYNNKRLAYTNFFINKDYILDLVSPSQDIFALAMISYFIFTKNTLTFSDFDPVNKFTTKEKLKYLLSIDLQNNIIKQKEYMWINYLLDYPKDMKSYKKLTNYTNFNYEDKLDSHSINLPYEINEEYKTLSKYVKSKTLVNYRLFKSNDYGEILNPNSYQHGLAGYLLFLSLDKNNYNYMLEIVKQFESYSNKNNIHESSLLFGTTGYTFILLKLYETTLNEYYINIATTKFEDIYLNYNEFNNLDFATGLSGVTLTALKFSNYINNALLTNFINKSIKILHNKLRDFNSSKFDFDNIGFAHGITGIAFVLNKANLTLKSEELQKDLNKFNLNLENYLIELIKNKKEMTNMEMSWCRGLSGLILYLEFLKNKKYNSLIIKLQDEILKHHSSFGTTLCHGISSLLITTNYSNNYIAKQKIINILYTRSYRDEFNNLLFFGENFGNHLFDFGVGTTGIYWAIMNSKFPFE